MKNIFIVIVSILIITSFTFAFFQETINNSTNNDNQYTLVASQSSQEYIPGILTPTYEFNKELPGPLIKGEINKELSVLAKNNIHEPITIHWHGMQLPNEMDGVPDVTQEAIKPGDSFLYRFIPKNPGVYWYHSHVDTHKQVEMGLQGPIIIEDPDNLIPADSDSVLVIDDVAIDNEGKYSSFDLNYMHGRYGNLLLVNGQRNPTIEVSGQFHRFRIINTANARSFNLDFGGNNVTVIGEDIGFVQPYTKRVLTIHPGERYDVIVETTSSFALSYPTSRSNTQLAYVSVQEPEYSREEFSLPQIEEENLPPEAITMEPTYVMNLRGFRDATQGLVWEIGGKNSLTNPGTFEVKEGELTKIRLTNLQGQPHPLHLHGQKFKILSRNGKEPAENGWKDSLMIGSGETVDIAFIAEGEGKWVFHCHILEHARAGMLTSITVK